MFLIIKFLLYYMKKKVFNIRKKSIHVTAQFLRLLIYS